MPITSDDVKLLKPQRVSDNADGGGRMTLNEVQDNVLNELFDDVSRLDRTLGRVSLRKAFHSIQSQNADPFLGAHAILVKTADDPLVDVTLFSTGSDSDERTNAQQFVESYVVRGPTSRYFPYDRQVTGARSILLLARPSVPAPEVGEVYALTQAEDQPGEIEQFVRLRTVTQSLQTFSHSQVGDYIMQVFQCEIDQPLAETFDGFDPEPFDDYFDSQYSADERPRLRRTTVADAAKYYGVKALTADAEPGDLSINVDSVFSQLVPTTQAETALLDRTASGEVGPLVTTSATQLTSPALVLSQNNTHTIYLPTGIEPGSLSHTSAAIVDDGAGAFDAGAAGSGTVNYAAGQVVLVAANSVSGSFVWTPAVPIVDQSHTRQIDVTIQNRQSVYVATLRPIPAPGSVRVHYRALGKWNVLADDGDGTLIGESGDGIGSGTVNYVTGSISVTVAALPDAGSAVLFFWGTPGNYEVSDGALDPPRVAQRLTLGERGIEPGSVTITYDDVNGTITASDSSSDGRILVDTAPGASASEAGDEIGRIIYSSGDVYLTPLDVPDAGEQYQIDYSHETEIVETFTPTKDGNGFVTCNLSTTPVKAGSVRVEWETRRAYTVAETTYVERRL